MTAWSRVAATGTPPRERRAKNASSGTSSPIATVTLGPIHIIALIVGIRPRQISRPTSRPPASPNTCRPLIRATSICPARSAVGVV